MNYSLSNVEANDRDKLRLFKFTSAIGGGFTINLWAFDSKDAIGRYRSHMGPDTLFKMEEH
jgi:hypothetical protein